MPLNRFAAYLSLDTFNYEPLDLSLSKSAMGVETPWNFWYSLALVYPKLAYRGGTYKFQPEIAHFNDGRCLRNAHQNFQRVFKEPLQASRPISIHS
ncbi:hypothetical protein AYI70_g7764 [Smittium culicis]|uniref:Uncharacterized protein n=1 Tax=Smittium culicis TaxID=133412 RepID=A0A1R1XJ43_9FUNG|nr:hypothetical protein AYI70_g7764 [Smittium culicis]